jgi:S1-C subfamily serine protease
VIVAIGDLKVTQFEDVVNYLEAQTHVGDVVTLTVVRDGAETKIDVTLEERPANR